MPSNKEQWDKTIADIAIDAYLVSQGQVVMEEDLNGKSVRFLQDVPAQMTGPRADLLQNFARECFGEKTKIVTLDVLYRWLKECSDVPGVDPNNSGSADKLLAFITDQVDQSGASKAKTLNAQLVGGAMKMDAWACKTLDQVGVVQNVVTRLNDNFKNTPRNADDAGWVKALNDASARDAQATGKSSPGSLYDTALRVNNLWLGGQKYLTDVLDGKATLTESETALSDDTRVERTLTEIAACANAIEEGDEPKVNGRSILVAPSGLSAGMDLMVRGVGQQLLGIKNGITDDGRVVDHTVVAGWTFGAPASDIGSSPDPQTRGTNLISYVTTEIKNLNATGSETSDQLADAYQKMNSRKCDTIVQSSKVVDYADDLVARAQKSQDKTLRTLYKDQATALKTLDDIMAKDKSLKGTSKFAFVIEVKRVETLTFDGKVMRNQEGVLEAIDAAKIGEGPDKELVEEK